MATAFMGEPTTIYNMLLDAANEAKSGKAGSKKKAGKILTAVLASGILTALMAGIMDAIRDDEDEKKDENGNIIGTRSFWDKYLEAVPENFVDSYLGLIPYIKDIVSIFQGYDVNRSDTEWIKKIYYAFTKLDSDDYTTAEKIDILAGAVTAAFGIPYANVSRDLKAIYRTFFGDGTDGTASYRGYLLYRSVLEGDKETYQELYNGYREDGKTDKEIQGVLRSALVTYSPLIAESVAAKLDGDLNAYETDIQKMIQSGFQRELVLEAVKNFEQKLKTIAGYRVEGRQKKRRKRWPSCSRRKWMRRPEKRLKQESMRSRKRRRLSRKRRKRKPYLVCTPIPICARQSKGESRATYPEFCRICGKTGRRIKPFGPR